MDSGADDSFSELLRRAAAGDGQAWGALLEHYRTYLKLLARLHVSRRLQCRADASDLVQESFLQAHRKQAQFAGSTEAELLAWLRQILASRLAKFVRRYFGTQARDARLEQNLADQLEHSSQVLDRALLSPSSSPSHRAMGREETVRVANALDKVPDDYREVLVLRHMEGLTFPVVAERMGRSVGAVTQLWTRAVRRLREVLEDNP